MEGKNTLGESLKFGLIAVLIVIPIRLFIAQPFIVSGASMDPTFEDGEYLVVDQLSYRLSNAQRGDIAIFRAPEQPNKFYIKRVIGEPGDTIIIRDGIITIKNEQYPDGLVLDEPYIKRVKHENATYELKEGQYFVMGDNRTASSDSRSWGPVPEELMVGKAILRLYPLKHADILPGNYRYDGNQNN
jgi:signal peptidase I